ncbi:MAG: hypothetical protein US40_C0010G0007 [Candidatus Roizmanbacteria bacterium GW2011_GWC2_37_13]|uniref:EamA domain-containing protein n=1 Tax=Candidatus Roizmanbacteria bacterium GW2011_GWC2_37_13 TaxID=1618486 RepID=A0A0G0ILY3_9BACT|nr:MAG: hypothetical protein US38_C0011G0034 [Candidatus Roizmanbacteria bacterium GW2011_GWC1_37_12]KKQ25224.1 MAG: hypothetical protein US40_C0010G0007 [Candidatus Roizmanbacteria bacterium GW2011_GWC2_37_13]
MSFTLAIWISSFAYGVQTIVGKLTAKYSLSNPWHLNFVWTLFNLIIVVPMAIVSGIIIPSSITLFVVSGFFLALGNIFLTYSLYKLDITIFSPLFALRTAFTAILGLLFLGEKFTLFQYLLILLIFISGMFIKIDENFSFKKFKLQGLGYGIACMFFLSLSSMAIKIASVNGNYWNNIFWINIFTTLFLIFTIPMFIKEITKTPLKKYFGALGYSLFGGIGRILMFFGLATNVTITTVVTSLPLSMIITIPLVYIFPKLLEKHSTKIYIYRLILAAIMVGSAIELSLR